MKEFKTYHPIVNFAYFVFVIGFSCFFMHPVCLASSLVSAFTYSVMLKGRRQIKKNLIYTVLTISAMALINPAFNHEGMTIIRYLPDGNPLTAESVIYGIAAGTMIVSVIMHFSCYSEIMTSDKFIYLFGRIIPAMSLIISMTLRFVPRFASQLRLTADARRCMGRDVSSGSIIKRAKSGLGILSVMTTWSLENAIETADSMKSRGYGLPGRTAFSIFTFDKRDRNTLICILTLGVYTIFGYTADCVYIRYFPSVESAEISVLGISVLAAYFLLLMCPVVIEIREVIKWNALRSKM